MTVNLLQLQQVSKLRFQQSEQVISKLRSREASLRSELSRLQNLARETNDQHPSDAPLRSIGADIIWLKWLENSRKILNIELAQVLAQKEQMMAQYRLANGKKLVTDALLEKEQLDKHRSRRARALDEAIETSLTHAAFNSPDAQFRR